MKKHINITETECKLMNELWKESMLSIGELIERLDYTGWSDSTIKTLVRRLNKKGAVGIDKTLNHFRYYPCITEDEYRHKETDNLIQRVYNGSAKMLMANLVSESNLSDDDVRELMSIIDKMDRSGSL